MDYEHVWCQTDSGDEKSEIPNNNIPAWVLRMEKATDVGGHGVETGYRCSGFEANAVAKEWRDNQAEIQKLREEIQRLREDNRKLSEHAAKTVAPDLLCRIKEQGEEIQRLREENERLKARLSKAREKLDQIVCTVGEDAGVVMLDQEGTTHTETINGQTIQVYDHEYFSPLGDALIDLWKILGDSEGE